MEFIRSSHESNLVIAESETESTEFEWTGQSFGSILIPDEVTSTEIQFEVSFNKTDWVAPLDTTVSPVAAIGAVAVSPSDAVVVPWQCWHFPYWRVVASDPEAAERIIKAWGKA